MYSFKKWCEAANYRNFLQGALDEFPDNSILLIFADALEDDGDPLANIIRQLASGNLQGDYQKIVNIFDSVRSQLEKEGIEIHRDAVYYDAHRYAWKGSTIVQSRRHGGIYTPIHLDQVPEEVIKALAVLAGELYASSINRRTGLQNDIEYRRSEAGLTNRGLSKELKDRQTDARESALRHSIWDFLTYFEQIESEARRLAGATRRRERDLGELEQSISENGTGYLMQIPATMRILKNYVSRYGTTDFLNRLGQRISATLANLTRIPGLRSDSKIYNSLNELALIIKRTK